MKSILLNVILIFIATTIFYTKLSNAQTELDTLTKNNSENINYRLPPELIPKTYKLKIKFLQKPSKGFMFSGTVDIGIWVGVKTNKIVLHSGKLLVINRISIFNDKSNLSIKYNSMNYDEITEKMTLFLADELPEDSFIYVNISYSGGILKQNIKGFYSEFNRQLNITANEYIATQFKPIHARNAFPCFDEPQYKANFTIEIERSSALKTISNMPAKNTSPIKGSVVNAGNNMEIDIFETSIPMPTYLVGFFVSDFEYRRESNGKLTIWTRPFAIDQIIYALGVITKARDFFTKYFSEIQNPLQKMDVVAIHNSELDIAVHLGLIVFDESNLLHHQDYTSDVQIQKISAAIFRTWASSYVNLVTPKWWDASWIYDALVTYLAYNATAKVEPEWKMDQLFVVDHLQSALADDALVSSKALERNIETSTEIQEIDDKMIKSKGASLLRMLDLSFDPSLFRNSLKKYLKARMHQTSTPTDFWSFYQTELDSDSFISKTNITQFMNTWTTQPGYPLVTVTVINNTVNVNQQRFTYDNSDSNSTESPIWHIPLTWATERNPDFENVISEHWIAKSNEEFPEMDISHKEWIIFNAQQSGFYRVNYDTNTWNQIIRALQSENFGGIPVINRAAIIDDLFNLARAGCVEYSMALSAAKYLINETSYIPWKAAMNNFNFIASRIANDNTYKLFKGYISSLLNNSYLKIGFNTIKTNYEKKMFGNYLRFWACDHGNLNCLTHSLTLFKQWINSSSEFVDPNYRKTIYRVAANQDNQHWDFLWNKYLETNVQSEKSRIIKALGTTTDPNKIHQLLSNVISPAIKMTHHDSLIAFASVYSSGGFLKLEQTLTFLETNFDQIRDHFRDDNKVNIILSEISSKLVNEKLVNQFRMFVEKDGSFKQYLQSYLSKASDNLNWSGIYEAGISRFLVQGHSKPHYLPIKNTKPVKYFVEMIPRWEEQFAFEGNVNITLKSLSEISSVVLDSYQLDVKQITVTISNTTKLEFPSFLHLDDHQIMISFGTDIPAKTKFDVSIKYSGFINETCGLYRSSYIGDDNQTHWMIATQFRKYGAAFAFPCIDDPALQTEFYLKIFRRNRCEILSNMKLINSDYDDAVNGSWDLFKESDATSLQNIAFIITDDKNSNNSDKEDKGLEKYIKTVQTIEKNTLKFLKNFTGLGYPVETIRYGLIPDSFTDDPETWPFFAFSELELPTINKNDAPIDVWREMYLSVINKLVNIWLSKVVIPNSYKHMWINEGLARYLQWFIGDRLQPQLKLMDQFVVYEVQKALQRDSVANTFPINNCDLDYNKIKYGNGTNYGKIASLLNMIRNAFSNHEFDKSLKLYFSTQRNGVSSQPMDLWKAIAETLKTMRKQSEHFVVYFSSMMKQWTDQSGYPIIHATIADNNLTLIQHRFSITGNNSSGDNLYWIPISIATKTNFSFKNSSAELFLNERGIVSNGSDVKDEWFILNVQQTGFYRVNYNLKNWYQLFTALKGENFGGIPEINRAQTIDDLMNLARADYVSYELAFSGVEYLVREQSHLPWKAFFNAIDYLYDRFDNQKVSKVFNNYLGKLIKPIYEKYKTRKEHSDDVMMNRLNRQLIVSWACKIKYPDCIYNSRKIFKQWRRNSTRFSISPDIKETVLCTAIKHGDDGDWNFLWGKHQASKIGWERVVMLKALGCSSNRTIVNQYLDLTISDDGFIEKKYVGTVLSSVIASGQSNLNTAFHFLKENYRQLFKRFGSWDPVNKLFSALAEKMSSSKKVIELTKFYSDNKFEFKTIMPNFNKIIESTNHNVKWYDNHVTEIEYWLMSREHIFMSGQNDTHANNDRINGILMDEECASQVSTVKIIIGCLIVVIVFLIIIAILGPYCLRKNRRRRSESVRKISLEMSMESNENFSSAVQYQPGPIKNYISHL